MTTITDDMLKAHILRAMHGDIDRCEAAWMAYVGIRTIFETLVQAQAICPWDTPLEDICPKHGGPLKDCPWMHHQMPTYPIEVHE